MAKSINNNNYLKLLNAAIKKTNDEIQQLETELASAKEHQKKLSDLKRQTEQSIKAEQERAARIDELLGRKPRKKAEETEQEEAKIEARQDDEETESSAPAETESEDSNSSGEDTSAFGTYWQ